MDDWSAAVTFALVGRQLPVAARTVEELLDALARAGWDAPALAAHVRRVRAAGEPWPHPVPDELRQRVGAAKLHAGLVALQARLGVQGATVPPAPKRPLTERERALVADAPPHHGT